MPTRLRKFIGLILFVAVLVIYVYLASTLSDALITHETNPIISIIFYAIVGLLWVVPAALVISWMTKQK